MNSTNLTYHKNRLENHILLITDTIKTLEDLRTFMEHHVYAVWDFMSLVKSLQHHICPSGSLWLPTTRQRRLSRLINQIVLAEESDITEDGASSISHFDLYLQAMTEIGADTEPVLSFIDLVSEKGIDYALEHSSIPEPSRKFMQSTFEVIETKQAHKIASAFAYGRETVIPSMFRRIINQLIDLDTPKFQYYLNRHIEVDQDDHGPMALDLVGFLCEFDPIKIMEAEQTAIQAIHHRIEFWDSLHNQILYGNNN